MQMVYNQCHFESKSYKYTDESLEWVNEATYL